MKYISEFIGSFFLVATVVGSGIMGDNLSPNNAAVALLGNTIATGAILFVIIKMFGNISGAHFNPAVSLLFYLRKELELNKLLNYILFQFLGGLLAVFLIHYIFNLELFQISTHAMRVEGAPWSLFISEIIATTGLILTILFVRENDESSIAVAVALFITAGYWFTSSTSFANPMVTTARIFTDTFTGINPISVPYYISGQIVGIFLSFLIFKFYKKQ
jgi:glycerol uptake facilitator-like aquaporin